MIVSGECRLAGRICNSGDHRHYLIACRLVAIYRAGDASTAENQDAIDRIEGLAQTTTDQDEPNASLEDPNGAFDLRRLLNTEGCGRFVHDHSLLAEATARAIVTYAGGRGDPEDGDGADRLLVRLKGGEGDARGVVDV